MQENRSDTTALSQSHAPGHCLLQWPEITEHRRDQFRHRGMDMDSALDDRVRRVSVHHIEQRMDNLVTSNPKYRCT